MNENPADLSPAPVKQSRKALFWEIFRFAIVGGVCFLIDVGVLAFFKEIVFHHTDSNILVLISTTISFLVSVTVNYILSVIFVFSRADQRNKGKSRRAMLVFLIGAAVGWLLTEGIMALGLAIFGAGGYWYLIVKIFATCVVMVWNYISRKVFIFK